MNDPEVLVQADAHGLKARYNLLDAHPSLLYFELKRKIWPSVTIQVPLGSEQATADHCLYTSTHSAFLEYMAYF